MNYTIPTIPEGHDSFIVSIISEADRCIVTPVWECEDIRAGIIDAVMDAIVALGTGDVIVTIKTMAA